MKFTNKEDRDRVDMMNRLLGTSHRVRPYDFKRKEDVIEAFDESLEYYCPEGWIKLGFDGTTNDEDYDNARESLRDALNYFEIILGKSEKRCIKMWEIG